MTKVVNRGNGMYKCPTCKKNGLSEHFMRCVHCYETFTRNELREAKKK